MNIKLTSGRLLNRNELKKVTGGIKFDSYCPQTCTYRNPEGVLMFGCPYPEECMVFVCNPGEYGVHCAL